MSFGTFSFYLWLVPAILFYYLICTTGVLKRWQGLIALSLIFIFLRDKLALYYFLPASILVFYSAQKIQGASPQYGQRSRFWIYWSTLSLLIFGWALSRSTEVFHFGLSLSYFSFYFIGYLTEVYWGRSESENKFGPYLAASTSFSFLTSGPIPQSKKHFSFIKNPIPLDRLVAQEALLRIFCGLAKKNLANFILNWQNHYQEVVIVSPTHSWFLELHRGARLYADFSGYTDIAIGIGLLLGHRLPENFHLPFLSTSVSSYWRKWNASVTDWFLTYVFTPLTLRLRWLARDTSPFFLKLPALASTYLTLLLVGLWHGFYLNQLIWGLLVGTLIVLESLFPLTSFRMTKTGIFLTWIFTFYTMTIARVFSTEVSFDKALQILASLHTATNFVFNSRIMLTFLIILMSLTVPHLADFIRERYPQTYKNPKIWFFSMVIIGIFLILISGSGQSFIYEGL